MKTNIQLKFRPSVVKGHRGALCYQVQCDGVSHQFTSHYRIDADEWDVRRRTLLRASSSALRSVYLESLSRWVQRDMQRLSFHVAGYQARGITSFSEWLVDELHTLLQKHPLNLFAEEVVAKLYRTGHVRTAETYRTTLNSLNRFVQGEEVMLEDLDAEFLQAYECYLHRTGIVPNTISFYMRRLRALYNRALERFHFEDRNPFRRVYTSSERTVKRAIPLKHLKQLKALNLTGSPSKQYARDMFLFSFYTRGMSFIDMAYLKKTDLRNGILTYRRSKTGQSLTLQWEPCMQQVLDHYPSRSSSEYLFPIICYSQSDKRNQYKNALARINRSLKELGRSIGLSLPLTMYVARHSWASIAHSEGIPLSVISQGMGHESEKTTRIYLASLDNAVIDKANRKILQLV